MKHSRTLALRLVLLTMLVAFSGLTYFFVTRSRPVVSGYVLRGDPVKEPSFAIFNPFRDRKPEQRADEFLTRLQKGDCESAMRELSPAASVDYQTTTCERERTLRLRSWKLQNRRDENNRVRLYYEVTREQYSDNVGQIWVTVEKGRDDWQVTRYDRYY